MKMHYYKDENNTIWGYDDEQISGGFVREGLVKISEKEADKLLAPPPPTKEQLIEQAEAKKQRLITEVQTETEMLRTKLALGRIKEDEKSLLNAWLDYLDELEAVDVSTAPDIIWPVKPVA